MTPLRGREGELASLDELIASVCAGAGGVITVEGAAGIGKSRLLAEAREHAASASLLVAVGGADELDQVTPWGVLLRAFSSSDPPIMASTGPDSLRRLTDQRLAAVERMRVAIEQAAASRPVLVVLDDLQWADAASLLALGSLPVALFSYPVGWLLGLRPLPANPTVDTLLERLGDIDAIRLHLGPLAIGDAVALARDAGVAGSDADLDRRIAGAGGNPFYILQLVKAVAAGPGNSGSADARAAIAQHLRLLSADARWLLQVASVLGRDFTVIELAAMTARPASQLMGPVEEALRAEILAEIRGGLVFRHDLIRAAVYESLPVSARVALHRDAGQALQRTGASAVRVAGQLMIGARPGDELAIEVIGQAVSELASSSPGTAADLALRQLELVGEEDERQPEIVLSTVRVLGLAGRLAAAYEIGEHYLASRRSPPQVEAALQLQLRQSWLFDRLEAYPIPLPERLLRDPAVDPGVVAALVALDQMPKQWIGHGDEADRALAEALRVIAGRGLMSEFAVISRLQILNSVNRGYLRDALSRAEAALQAARSSGDPEGLGTHEEMVVTVLAASGRIGDALETMRTPLAKAEAAGRAGPLFRYRRLRSALLLSQGRLDDADAEARGLIDLAIELGYPNRIALPLSVVVETRLRRGEVAGARAILDRYASLTVGVLPDLHWAAALVGDARGETGMAAQALAPICVQLKAGFFGFATTQHHRLPQLVGIARRAGEEKSARAFAAAAAVLAGMNPQINALTAAAVHAEALIGGDAAKLREAAEWAAASEDRLLEAAAREDLGQALAIQPRGTEAAEQLETAYQLYLRIGAHRDVARVRAALRTLGIRKQQSSVAKPRHGWASLTKAEQAVVELVAEGLTNRETASELFLSPDTINTHLRHAFMKLGIRSRVELARLAAQRGKVTS